MTLKLDTISVSVPDGTATRTILQGLSLTVEPGEVVAITGASGTGKSTLLAVAGLLRRPDSGTITIDGTSVLDLPSKRLSRIRRRSIGFVFQSGGLFPSLTALEQVELAAHVAGRLDRQHRERARELLASVGLGDRLGGRPAELSGGERQRVVIARALMNDPSVLLADEPTAALDDQRGREVTALLVAESLRRSVAAVIVTHNPSQLPSGVRRLVLADGQVGPAPDVSRAPAGT